MNKRTFSQIAFQEALEEAHASGENPRSAMLRLFKTMETEDQTKQRFLLETLAKADALAKAKAAAAAKVSDKAEVSEVTKPKLTPAPVAKSKTLQSSGQSKPKSKPAAKKKS